MNALLIDPSGIDLNTVHRMISPPGICYLAAIGIIPPEKGLPRIHSMGCLLIPIISYFLI